MVDIESRFEFNDGYTMPIFGLGLYAVGDSQKVENVVKWAYQSNYRLFDTAQFYGNELGLALKSLNVSRDEVFLTSKVLTSNYGYQATIKTVRKSVERLDMEYFDLFLLHWPVEKKRLESWKALEDLQKEGIIKSIGVSNYMESHLDELLHNSEISPVLNQVECHPWLNQFELLAKCKIHDIVFQAYSPLVKGQRINDPIIVEIAKGYNKTPAQILIRWGLENETSVIPKSGSRERIQENSDVFGFELKKQDMDILNSLNENYHCTWDPTAQR